MDTDTFIDTTAPEILYMALEPITPPAGTAACATHDSGRFASPQRQQAAFDGDPVDPAADYQAARAICRGWGVDQLHELTKMDAWFLRQFVEIAELRGKAAQKGSGALVADDLGTHYAPSTGSAFTIPGGHKGENAFLPSPPVGARELTVAVEGLSISIPLS